MKIINYFVAIVLVVNSLYAQEIPPISVYTSKEYNAENQNWGISQASDKHIYIANNKGLLELDGSSWKLYLSPNETIVRSVKAINNKVYIGFYNGFGYWQKNAQGVLEFTSLSSDIDLLEDEQFWHIETLEGWVLFQSLQRIYLYNLNTKEFKVIQSDSKITSIYKVRGSIYYQEQGKGVFKLEKGVSKIVTKDDLVLKHDIVSIHDIDNKLVFVTTNKGLYYLENGSLKLWNTKLNTAVKDYTFYSSIKLTDDSLVLGTISNGVIFLDSVGAIRYVINHEKGLSNNTVLSIFQDIDQNIWLGLDDGINAIHINSPFRVYKNNIGVLGTVYTSIVHDDMLYLGTNQGLFFKRNNSDEEFSFVENTNGQVWTLKKIGKDLLCGHNLGTFLINKSNATLIGNVMGTWKIELISKNTFVQGNYKGLYVFEKKEGAWRLKNKIEGFNISSRYFEFLDKNTIFVNHEYKGVYKLLVNDDYTKISNVSILISTGKGIHSALLKYKGDILYSYKQGVYKYNLKEDGFVKDDLLSKYTIPENYSTGVLINMPMDNKLWGFSKKNITYIEQGVLSAKPIVKNISIPFKLRKGASGFENICKISQNKYLIGTSNGYITLKLNGVNQNKSSQVVINQIKNATLTGTPKNVNLLESGVFDNDENNFEFICSVPIYDKFSQVEYQYQLEGLSSIWSEWRPNSNVFFENLPFGTYQFKIRAKVNGVLTHNTATYGFKIGKPWYISTLMLSVYLLFIVGFSVFMHTMYTRYYTKQRERLLSRKQQEFELEKLENEQKLTLLEKEKLEVDVEIKNKELAGSTMNLIKKNELLNTIKGELLKGGQKNINTVIKIIDKNLNHTDDWKVFEEAFNNADKDFTKKIKDLHPSLTSNDLRLCAYLRLNLSSKEIAPLLNISSKSVEVKRYRLRKKMNLENDENLTDYILKI
ncbi:LuxR family transcriptional regulator [Wenyingzhuangia fucanilytica]|uniref:LuxR family transcriptional regulator n=1 Tax=Wenyingzhuangia fucanilytica TaxID=1790137 RepID=A0A1B1Y6S7_9FLAO|nr:triple tyrosine motif-containing protein [Wenyingzhuangia fucanilytica]ANW96476.1 LuxR family transcriptional regulator [Wenyingzhuangia fucanilytica]